MVREERLASATIYEFYQCEDKKWKYNAIDSGNKVPDEFIFSHL